MPDGIAFSVMLYFGNAGGLRKVMVHHGLVVCMYLNGANYVHVPDEWEWVR